MDFILNRKFCVIYNSMKATFASQFPMMQRISFLMFVLEGLVGLLRTIQLQH